MRISDWSSDVGSSDLKFVYFKVIPVLDEDPDARPMKKLRVTKHGDDAQHVSRQPLKESWMTHANLVDLESRKVLKALDAGKTEQLDITTSIRSEEHTSELQSLMRISYAVFCLKKQNQQINHTTHTR